MTHPLQKDPEPEPQTPSDEAPFYPEPRLENLSMGLPRESSYAVTREVMMDLGITERDVIQTQYSRYN